MTPNRDLNKFWDWFVDNSLHLSSERITPETIASLDAKMLDINPDLSWEIGPGKSKPSLFVISPNLNKNLVEAAKTVICAAPDLPGWEFYATRQSKIWNHQFSMKGSEGEELRLNTSKWVFVRLLHSNGFRELILSDSRLPELTEKDCWQAAAIVLESILGEEVMMNEIDGFSLLASLAPKLQENARPLTILNDTFKIEMCKLK